MSWEYVVLGAVSVLVIFLILFRKNPLVKLYWKYVLLLAPLVALIILKIISDSKGKGKTSTPSGAPGVPDPIVTKIADIRDDIVIAQTTALIEQAAAREKSNEKLETLSEISQIPDKRERLKRLAALAG
jgi:uncharacterized membrane protein